MHLIISNITCVYLLIGPTCKCVASITIIVESENKTTYKKKKKKKNDLFPTTTTFSHKLYKFELYIQLEKEVNKRC